MAHIVLAKLLADLGSRGAGFRAEGFTGSPDEQPSPAPRKRKVEGNHRFYPLGELVFTGGLQGMIMRAN